MSIPYSVSFEEYLAARRLLRFTSHQRYRAAFTIRWIIPALGLLLAGSALEHLREHGSQDAFWTWFLLFVGVYTTLSPFLQGRALRRRYQAERLGEKITLQADESGLYFESFDGDTRGSYRWAYFEKAIENLEVYVLLTKNARMIVLPKNAIYGNAGEELLSLLRQNIATIAK